MKFSWPGMIRPGSRCHRLVQHTDLMATFADILGATLPPNAGEDSFSLLPLLKGGTDPVRDHGVSCASSGVPALRSGSWKLIPGRASGGLGRGTDSHEIKLYNLADDPGETNNLAALEPGRVSEMKALLEKLITNGRSTPGAKQPNDVEVRRYPH